MHIAAVIVAAGRGHRAGGGLPKQYRVLAGRTVLRRTLDAFLAHAAISAVQVVIHPDDAALYEEAVAGLGLPAAVHGGATRMESVAAGLDALARMDPVPEAVLIHDAARPFVSPALIARVADAIRPDRGAMPGLAVTDTLRRIDGGACGATVARDGLWRAQTPQGFPFAPLRAAFGQARGDETDDVEVAVAAGLTVVAVEGDEANVKLTTEADFEAAERSLARAMETRVGTGFDVHAFGPGDHVWMCGVRIPHDHGLAGHSDADVGLHALTDALLGAIGAGDIGQHFPPTDPQWKGASSDRFLAHAGGLVHARGGRIVHVDVTLVCERPKIGPHREAMCARIAEILEIAPDRVSVKATTTEKLGFTGRGEGAAAQAVASVEVPRVEGSRA